MLGTGGEPASKRRAEGASSRCFTSKANGFACVNLANGTERNHEPGERVSVDALEGMLEVAFAIVEEAAVEEAPA